MNSQTKSERPERPERSSKSDSDDSDSKKKKTPKGPWQTFRENVEAIVVAVILALIIRHFSLEAFEIPTGSMAPGLNGVHVESTCPNCGTVSDVGIQTDSQTGKIAAPFSEGLVYSGVGPQGEVIEDRPGKLGVSVRHPKGGHIDSDPAGFRRAYASQFEAWCPHCQLAYTEVFESSDCVGGHKILVNKFVYFMREPRRWEVIVFKFNRQRNYIKRLVALPGESIQVVNGDLWIDGKVERKPEWAQDEMWFSVSDTDLTELGFVTRDRWKASDPKVWEPGQDGSAYMFRSLEGAGTLTYQREITNRYAYNAQANSRVWGGSNGTRRDPPHSGRDTDWWVRDLKVSADVVVVGERGTFELRIQNGKNTYRCRIPAGTGQPAHPLEFWVDNFALRDTLDEDAPKSEWSQRLGQFYEDPETKKGSAARLVQNVEHLLEFYLADRQLVLRIDGETVATLPFEETGIHRVGSAAKGTVAVHVEGISGHVRRLQVHRDIHYTTYGRYNYATVRAHQLNDDEYFAMGDNSPSSLDSRAWGAVAKENMLGRALAVFWPALPWRFEVGFIR